MIAIYSILNGSPMAICKLYYFETFLLVYLHETIGIKSDYKNIFKRKITQNLFGNYV